MSVLRRFKLVFFSPTKNTAEILAHLFTIFPRNVGRIGEYEQCAFIVKGIGKIVRKLFIVFLHLLIASNSSYRTISAITWNTSSHWLCWTARRRTCWGRSCRGIGLWLWRECGNTRHCQRTEEGTVILVETFFYDEATHKSICTGSSLWRSCIRCISPGKFLVPAQIAEFGLSVLHKLCTDVHKEELDNGRYRTLSLLHPISVYSDPGSEWSILLMLDKNNTNFVLGLVLAVCQVSTR